MKLIDINNDNYFLYGDIIKELIKKAEYDEAESILLKIIEIMEKHSRKTGDGVAPAYYFDLAKIYAKTKKHEDELVILKRFLIQIKSRGQKPKKILDRYLKLRKNEDHNQIKQQIYFEYLETIKNIKLEKLSTKCQVCQMEIILLIPKGVILGFGSCCPYCMESGIFGAREQKNVADNWLSRLSAK